MICPSFARIWCLFEEGVLLLAQRGMLHSSENDGRAALCSLMLDIATVHEGKAQLLTQGLSPAEEKMEEEIRQSGWTAKAEREDGFPIQVIAQGLGVSLRGASASQARNEIAKQTQMQHSPGD